MSLTIASASSGRSSGANDEEEEEEEFNNSFSVLPQTSKQLLQTYFSLGAPVNIGAKSWRAIVEQKSPSEQYASALEIATFIENKVDKMLKKDQPKPGSPGLRNYLTAKDFLKIDKDDICYLCGFKIKNEGEYMRQVESVMQVEHKVPVAMLAALLQLIQEPVSIILKRLNDEPDLWMSNECYQCMLGVCKSHKCCNQAKGNAFYCILAANRPNDRDGRLCTFNTPLIEQVSSKIWESTVPYPPDLLNFHRSEDSCGNKQLMGKMRAEYGSIGKTSNKKRQLIEGKERFITERRNSIITKDLKPIVDNVNMFYRAHGYDFSILVFACAQANSVLSNKYFKRLEIYWSTGEPIPFDTIQSLNKKTKASEPRIEIDINELFETVYSGRVFNYDNTRKPIIEKLYPKMQSQIMDYFQKVTNNVTATRISRLTLANFSRLINDDFLGIIGNNFIPYFERNYNTSEDRTAFALIKNNPDIIFGGVYLWLLIRSQSWATMTVREKKNLETNLQEQLPNINQYMIKYMIIFLIDVMREESLPNFDEFIYTIDAAMTDGEVIFQENFVENSGLSFIFPGKIKESGIPSETYVAETLYDAATVFAFNYVDQVLSETLIGLNNHLNAASTLALLRIAQQEEARKGVQMNGIKQILDKADTNIDFPTQTALKEIKEDATDWDKIPEDLQTMINELNQFEKAMYPTQYAPEPESVGKGGKRKTKRRNRIIKKRISGRKIKNVKKRIKKTKKVNKSKTKRNNVK